MVQHSRCDLTSVKQWARIIFPHRLATLFLLQPRMLLAIFAARANCQMMSSLVSTSVPRSFLQRCYPASYLQKCLGLFLLRCKTFVFFEFHKVPVNPFLQFVLVPLDSCPSPPCPNHFLAPFTPIPILSKPETLFHHLGH